MSHRTRAVSRPAIGAATAAALWALLAAVLPHGAPAGVLLAGAVFGAINALVAVSIVLVHRANRVVNFAAAEFGSVAAVIAIELHIVEHVNYFLAVLTGLVAAAVMGAAVDLAILRRFGKAPRLIVAVVTIGLAQVLNGLSVLVPIEWNGANNSGSFTTPWSAQFRIYPVVFNGNYVLAIVVVPIVMMALAWFLRFTHYGVAIRAAAENGDRARLLGVPVPRLSTLIWTITGVLSALAVLLRVPIIGFTSFDSVSSGGLPLLLQTLTAAVVGSMASLPATVTAAVGIGVADQLSAWTFHDATYVDAALLAVVLIVLLAKRGAFTRAVDTGISTWQAIRPVRPVPPELAELKPVGVAGAGLVVAVVAAALALPEVLTPARTQLLTLITIYAIVACSLVVLTGWAGHISLGQVAFMGFGGATTAVLITRHGADMFLALAAGMVVAGAAAFIIGLPALRISGPFLAVTTLAFAVTSANYFLVPQYFGWFDPTEPLPALTLFGRIRLATDKQMYYFCLIALAVVVTAVRALRSTHAGRALIAGKENRLAAQSFAIDTTRTNLAAFTTSGMIAGLAGGLFVIQQQGFHAGAFNAEQGLQFFTMVVIGGLGSLMGGVLGAVYVYGVQYLLPPGWSILATGAGIVALLMFLPGGLGEVAYRARDAVLRRIAARRGLAVPGLTADATPEAALLDATSAPRGPVTLASAGTTDG